MVVKTSVQQIIHNQYKHYQRTELDLYVALHYSHTILNVDSLIIVTMFTTISLLQAVQTSVMFALLAALLLFFRPLLWGMCRALALTVRPRATKPAKAARQAQER